jgi:hypothetical protein
VRRRRPGYRGSVRGCLTVRGELGQLDGDPPAVGEGEAVVGDGDGVVGVGEGEDECDGDGFELGGPEMLDGAGDGECTDDGDGLGARCVPPVGTGVTGGVPSAECLGNSAPMGSAPLRLAFAWAEWAWAEQPDGPDAFAVAARGAGSAADAGPCIYRNKAAPPASGTTTAAAT